MDDLNKLVEEYFGLLSGSNIRKAYRGLLEYISGLRLYLNRRYPDYSISSSIQDGRMDYTYFYFTPPSLRERKLKIVIIFVHYSLNFQIWLAGYNKMAQHHYQQLFRLNGWNKYTLSRTTKDVDSIIEHTLIETPDFKDPENLTEKIEDETLKFICDIEEFLKLNSDA